LSVSANSVAAFFTMPGSAHTPARSLIGWKTRSPAAIASRYDGIFCGIVNV